MNIGEPSGYSAAMCSPDGSRNIQQENVRRIREQYESAEHFFAIAFRAAGKGEPPRTPHAVLSNELVYGFAPGAGLVSGTARSFASVL